MNDRCVLVTGASGRLGKELVAWLKGDIFTPSHVDMDVTDQQAVRHHFQQIDPDVVVHLAAYTNVAAAEDARPKCWACNVDGTQNVVREAAVCGARFVHISTDYVFDGTIGNYSEDDPTGPACNYYARSKIAAEDIVLKYHRALVLRCSFRAGEWPHPEAYDDAYTSQDYVDVIAPKIAATINAIHRIDTKILHIGTLRKSAYELARRRKPDIKRASRGAAPVFIPQDVSLNTARWDALHLDAR